MKRLIDADELKERFLVVAKSGGPVVHHVSDICATIEDAVVEQDVGIIPGWIPVTERLPTTEDGDRKGLVLTVDRYGTMETYHVVTVKGNPDLFTHWMPLPEAPKEVEADGE